MKNINILIACEESQTICKAFRDLGFNAYSCDIKRCSGGLPEYHILGDCFEAMDSRHWDLIIAHPPCTFLALSGNRWMHDKVRFPNREQDRKEAIDFFMRFVNYEKCSHMAIENPLGVMSTVYRKPDQIINPFQFGDPFRKPTCLWLKGLPLLQPTEIVSQGEFVITKSGKKMPKWYSDAFGLPKEERATLRSKTFPGIAKAIAEQWGGYLLNEKEDK